MPLHITPFFQNKFENHFKAFLKHEMRMPLEDTNNDVIIFCRDAVLSLIDRIVDAISRIYERLLNRTEVKAYPDMFLAIHMVLSRDLATHLIGRDIQSIEGEQKTNHALQCQGDYHEG